MSESVILCEGYHDRAFWKGWLTHLGCSDPGEPVPGSSRRRDIIDPWNNKVMGGQYAYRSQANHFLRIIPCHGDRNRILDVAKDRLMQRTRKSLLRLVINVDADTTASGVQAATGLRAQDVENFLRGNVDPQASRNAAGDVEVDGGQTLVSLVRWEVADPPDSALPDQQTLERLTCAAIGAAYPARKAALAAWLNSRPAPPCGKSQRSFLVVHGGLVCRARLREFLFIALERPCDSSRVGDAFTCIRSLANRDGSDAMTNHGCPRITR